MTRNWKGPQQAASNPFAWTVGTNGHEYLDATGGREILLGLDGDDDLVSFFDQTLLFGGAGDD
ncbi:MAG: hypothetical protein ACWA5A_07905, partial [Marinibacterium sp.]